MSNALNKDGNFNLPGGRHVFVVTIPGTWNDVSPNRDDDRYWAMTIEVASGLDMDNIQRILRRGVTNQYFHFDTIDSAWRVAIAMRDACVAEGHTPGGIWTWTFTETEDDPIRS